MKPDYFCKHHGGRIDIGNGYFSLVCSLHNKICCFRLKGAIEFCPEFKPLTKIELSPDIDCGDGKCSL